LVSCNLALVNPVSNDKRQQLVQTTLIDLDALSDDTLNLVSSSLIRDAASMIVAI
jgi:hypothetical protein